MAITGAVLLLSAPTLYEAVYELGLYDVLPTLYPPTESSGCCIISFNTRFHDVPFSLFAVLHLAALIAFLSPRRTLVLVWAMAFFVPLQLMVAGYLAPPPSRLLWTSVLVPTALVLALIWPFHDVLKAAAVARMSMALLLAQTHLLIWSSWEGHPLVAGAWVGLLGGLLWAAGELRASRRPGSSASAWRPCPLPSRRTSWRRA